jgi:hypothetical protein
MKQLRKIFCIGFILFLLIFSNGCGLLKNINRTKDKTKIVTEFFIDTNIIIHYDTLPIYDTVKIFDTAFVENTTAAARSYFDFGMNKIVLELKGKEFSVPVKLHKKETKTEIKKETESKVSPMIIPVIILILGFLYLLILILKK